MRPESIDMGGAGGVRSTRTTQCGLFVVCVGAVIVNCGVGQSGRWQPQMLERTVN